MPFKNTGEWHVGTTDGRNFTLLTSEVFECVNGESITIPAGATSDGASTPPELWITIPPFGQYWKAAFLHDYLYRCTQRPKVECDSLLLEAMKSLGVPPLLALTIYEGVHEAGQSSFNADRAAQAATAVVYKIAPTI